MEASSDRVNRAEISKEEGNKLYKSQKLEEALEKYEEVANRYLLISRKGSRLFGRTLWRVNKVSWFIRASSIGRTEPLGSTVEGEDDKSGNLSSLRVTLHLNIAAVGLKLERVAQVVEHCTK